MICVYIFNTNRIEYNDAVRYNDEMNLPKRVGVYTRCSTQEQSTELQRREIDAYAMARGWTCLNWFEDTASGTTANRVNLKRLMAAARSRQIDTIIVWKLDRFARSLKDLVLMLQEFQELGVTFLSLKDQIDLGTSSGRLMLHLIGAFAEFEASLIRERVSAGLSNARAKGRRLGRSRKVDAERVIQLRNRGLSFSQIAMQMGLSKSAVHKTLQNLKR